MLQAMHAYVYVLEAMVLRCESLHFFPYEVRNSVLMSVLLLLQFQPQLLFPCLVHLQQNNNTKQNKQKKLQRKDGSSNEN